MPDENNAVEDLHIVRRVLSASALPAATLTVPSIAGRLRATSGNIGADIWSSASLSTEDRVISPRPLEPTHILLVYAESIVTSTVPLTDGTNTLPRRKGKAGLTMTYPEILEVPVNDLVFTLNVPNLKPTGHSGTISALPRRLHRELPRAMLRVPHLETFHSLVVYLHTKNQAELFSNIIPEWLRELMHPLPSLTARASPGSAVLAPPVLKGPHRMLGTLTRKSTRSLSMLVRGSTRSLGMLVSASTLGLGMFSASKSNSSLSVDNLDAHIPSNRVNSTESNRERTVDSVARKVAEVSAGFVTEDPVVRATASLDALRDNLNFLGYYGQAVWDELEQSREILIRAVGWKAKFDREEQWIFPSDA